MSDQKPVPTPDDGALPGDGDVPFQASDMPAGSDNDQGIAPQSFNADALVAAITGRILAEIGQHRQASSDAVVEAPVESAGEPAASDAIVAGADVAPETAERVDWHATEADGPPVEDFAYVPRAADRYGDDPAPANENCIEPVFEAPLSPEPSETLDVSDAEAQTDAPPEIEAPFVPAATLIPDRLDQSERLPPPAELHSPPSAPPAWRETALRYARFAAIAIGGYLAVVLALIVLYRFIDPPASTLMAYHWLTGKDVNRHWADIEDISPHLVRAVIVSEDWKFCDHHGVDLAAIEEAIEKAGDGIPRGASTISMQVIKNLFLSQSKSYVRKAIELPLTVFADLWWPKQRMLEIYLNIAEWGPGVFGAEAAAQHHFSKSAARLNEYEAALLAASLPNPMIRDAGDPGPRTARKAGVIRSRMRIAGPVAHCALARPNPPNQDGGRKEPKGNWDASVDKRAGAVPGL